MKIHKKEGGGAPFARKAEYEYEGTKYEADLQNGDTIKILDGGVVEQGQFGDQTNFKIQTRNGEKKQSFNQATQNVLHDAFGEESDEWIGKEVKVLLHKTVIAGKKVIIAYFVTVGWSLDDYGDLVSESQESKTEAEIKEGDIPFN